MATKTEHTPTPWRAWGDEVYGQCDETATRPGNTTLAVKTQMAVLVCDTSMSLATSLEQDDANAAFIARACNSHDALLAACEELLELAAEAMVRANYSDNTNYDTGALLASAIAALALAKGEM